MCFIMYFCDIKSCNISYFLNQQFITWSVRADYGSYFITTYMESEPTEEKSEMKWNKKRNEKKKKRNNR